MKRIAIILFVLIFPYHCPPVFGASFVVNYNADWPDTNPGDGICEAVLNQPVCTLRAAIEEANALFGSDTITFDAKFTSPYPALPAITDPGLTIDGSSQWDTEYDVPGIEIGTGHDNTGLLIKADDCVITGILFFGSGTGVHLWQSTKGNRIGGPGSHERNVFLNSGNWTMPSCGVFVDAVDSATIQYNYFGTRNAAGSWDADDVYFGYTGIRVRAGHFGSGTVIEHNIIGEQGNAGIHLDYSGPVTVKDNQIGSLTASRVKFPNRVGIMIDGTDAEISNNTIAGNVEGQITTEGGWGAGSPVILNNRIGNPYLIPGNSAQPADGINLYTYGSNLRIAGNVIEGNSGNGISITPMANAIATIENNFIRLNKQDGLRVILYDGSSTITGNAVYSNNGSGIVLAGHDESADGRAIVTGNWIGLDSHFFDGGNDASGIILENGANNNIIGGYGPTDANHIGFNKGSGIVIADTGTSNNYIGGNIIGSTEKSSLSGYSKAGNGGNGIIILDDASHNIIGAVRVDSFIFDRPNLILDSGMSGISVIHSDNNHIIGNNVGTDGDSRNWGNTESGIYVRGSNNRILFNTVANNGFIGSPASAGVVISYPDSSGNQISQNSIFHNGTAGISLRDGANHYLQPPQIQRAGNTISGTSYPSSTIEFFSGPDKDEGKFFEGSVQADSTGAFSWTKQGNFRGTFVTATATTSVSLSTSEFSSHVRGYIFPWPMFLPAIVNHR